MHMAFRLFRQRPNFIKPAKYDLLSRRFYADSKKDNKDYSAMQELLLESLIDSPFEPQSTSPAIQPSLTKENSQNEVPGELPPTGPSFSIRKEKSKARSAPKPQSSQPSASKHSPFYKGSPSIEGGLGNLIDSSAKNFNKGLPEYKLHAQCTNNNVILTFTDEKGMTKGWVSGGLCGFSNAQRSTYEAGYQCAVRMFKIIEKVAESKSTGINVHILYKGRGQAREALHKAILGDEGAAIRPMISRLTDKTPIKIGGTRAKKQRRL